jgi:hypothetical protein
MRAFTDEAEAGRVTSWIYAIIAAAAKKEYIGIHQSDENDETLIVYGL